MYLVTSLFIPLSGMTFQSGVATPGTVPYAVLTYFVISVLVGSVRSGWKAWRLALAPTGHVSLGVSRPPPCLCLQVLSFVIVFALEVIWSLRFAARVHVIRRKGSSLRPVAGPQPPGGGSFAEPCKVHSGEWSTENPMFPQAHCQCESGLSGGIDSVCNLRA